MEKLTIKDFGYKFQIPESTIRGWVAAKKLVTDVDVIKKRKTTLILLDKKAAAAIAEYKNVTVNFEELNTVDASIDSFDNEVETNFAARSETVQDAEFENIREIKEANTNFNLVSLETTTIERMLDQIQMFADERAKTLEETNLQVHNELFELKAEVKILREENKALIIKNAQFEVESNIKQKRIEELDEEIKKLNKIILKHEENFQLINTQTGTINNDEQKGLLKILSTKL